MAVVGANTRQTCSLVAEALGCSWKENLDLVLYTQSAPSFSHPIRGNGLYGWAEQVSLEQ